MARPKKIVEPVVEQQTETTQTAVEQPNTFAPENSTSGQPVKIVDTISVSKEEWDKVQEQLKMLTAVADKGRLFNYETRQSSAKKPMKVKLSVYNDKYIIGWKTIKDELVKHPTTGATVGEQQEYELSLLSKDGTATTVVINGYPAFSNARYGDRIECDVISKAEDNYGNLDFDLVLPDGQKVRINSRYIN